MLFFAVCILQHSFGSHCASTTEKIPVINSKEGGVPDSQTNQMCRVHWTRLRRSGSGRPKLLGDLFLLRKADFSHLSVCRAQEQCIYPKSSWALGCGVERRERGSDI